MKTDPDDCAFAFPAVYGDEGVCYDPAQFGMTKREYMATHILAGLMPSEGSDWESYDPGAFMAKAAVSLADKLIVAVNKEKT